MMAMKKSKWINCVLMIACILAVGACSDDDAPAAGKGEVEFEITDSPVDDANVKGVFVTIADIKVDGHSLEGFAEQTIDLKAYSEGKTKLIGTGQVDARTYENVVLVLDLASNADGDGPGCYVLDQNDVKHQLNSTASATADVVVSKSWSVVQDAKTTIVLDFDLRKALRYSDDQSAPYSFVSNDRLNAAVRLVTRSNSGAIEGTYEESTNGNADKVIVYAYKKGTFNASSETTSQGDDGVLFAHAVSSAEVRETLTGHEFTLAFLEEGDYELHFVGYSHDSATGRFQFQNELHSETSAGGALGDFVTVKSGVTLNVSAVITGII
jgi:hypothetical protein